MPTAIITSDLHLGLDPVASIQFLKQKVIQHDPSVIIIAGDIGESVKNFRECLSLFSGVKCPVGVVIGNHDLYAYDKKYPSEELWAKVLPGIVKKLGLVWMEEENIVVNDTAFVGTVGWYDYSSKTVKMPDRFYEEEKGAFVSDGNYIDWLRTDADFATELLKGLVGRLEKAPAITSSRPLFFLRCEQGNPYISLELKGRKEKAYLTPLLALANIQEQGGKGDGR